MANIDFANLIGKYCRVALNPLTITPIDSN